jgi:hypothetical protein
VTNIVTQGVFTLSDDSNDIIDIAAAPISYEAENASVGGGAMVGNSFLGFSGTGYVSLGSGVAGGFVDFQVNQNSGVVAYFLTYANGSNTNRPCNITVNGTVVGSFNFPPTGSWSNYTTYLDVTKPIDLGTAPGFRNVRITATTAAGGPSIDNIRFGAN